MSTGTVILNCARIADTSVGTVDYIARLGLGLKLSGKRLRLAEPSPELVDLIRILGLAETLGVEVEGLGVEVEGQPEKRKKLRCVEEEGELRDPPAGQPEDLQRPG